MKWKIPEDFKSFDALYALNSFGEYWIENERLIQTAAKNEEKQFAPKWTPKDDEEYAEYSMEIENIRHLHDKIMTPTFRYSCIVTLFAIVERELRRLVENLENEKGEQKLKYKELKGSTIEQVAKFCEAFFGLRLSNFSGYAAICDLQKIRDCIVHCQGEVAMSKDTKFLIQLKERRAGFSADEWTEIEIEPICIEQFIKEVWKFFMEIFHELKWSVDESWQKKRWA
jgi:hypothetical protein